MQRTTYAPTPQIGFRPHTPSTKSEGSRLIISKTQGRAILPGCTSDLVSQAYNFFGKPVGLRTGGGDERGTIQIATTEYNYRVGHNINELGARVFATDTFYVGDTEVRAIYFRKGQKVSDPVFEIVDGECPAILSQRQLAQALQAGELAYYSGGKEVKPKAFLNALHELMLAQPARDVTKEYVADMQEAVLSTFIPIAENLRRNRAGRQFFKDLVDCVQQEYPTTHEALAEIRHDYICRQRLPGNTPLYKLVRGLEGELESDGIVERAWQEFDGAIPSRQELRGKISEIARRETLEEPAKPNFVKQVASYTVAGLFGLAAWAVVKDISGEPGSWGAAAADSGSGGLPAGGRGAAEPTIPSDLDKISPVTISDIINFTYELAQGIDMNNFPRHLTNNGIIFENDGQVKFYNFRTGSVTTLPATSNFSLMAAERNTPDGVNLAQTPTLWNRFALSGKFLFGNNTILDAETGVRMLGITADEVYQPNLRDANGNQIFVLRDTTVSPPKLVYFQISPTKQYLSSPDPQKYDPDAALQNFIFGCGDKVITRFPDGSISSFKFAGVGHQTLTVLKKPKGTLQELLGCKYAISHNESSGYHHISRFDSFGNPVTSVGFVDLGFNLTSRPLYLGEDWFLITGPSPDLAGDRVAKQLLNAKTKQTVDLTALAGGPLLSQKVSYVGQDAFLYNTYDAWKLQASYIFKLNKINAALRDASTAITWDGRGHYLLVTDQFSAYFGIFDKLFKVPITNYSFDTPWMNSGWLTWLGTDSKVHYANLSALDTRLGYGSILTNFTKPASPQPGQPGDRFVHLSDTHIGASGADTRLGQMVNKILTFRPRPDFVVVSGDVADAGADSNSNYLRFLQLVKPLEDAGIGVFTVPGNHDYRARNDALGSSPYVGGLESLFDQRLGNYRALGERDIAGRVVDGGQYVLIGLDSGHDRVADVLAIDLAPEGSGLSVAQINWLGNTLDSLDGVQNGKDTSGKAKIIVMHHPAFGGAKEIFHGETIANYKTEFLALLKKYGVDVVLSGHTHRNFFGVMDSTKHVQTASTAYEGAWRNISIQNGTETVFVPNVLSKMVRVKTGSPVELQAYRSGSAVMPQVSSMFSVDGKDSVQREISVDYAPGLEFKVTGTRGAVPGATYKLEIALNSETNEPPVVFMSGVPIVSGTTHTYSVDWNKVASSDARAVALRHKTAEGREVAFALPPFVTGTQFEAALKAAQLGQGGSVQNPKSPVSSGIDWRVPAALGLLGGGAALGYVWWQRGRGGEELPETQTPIAPRREALRRQPVDVPRPAIPRRPRATEEPQSASAGFFRQMDVETPRAQPQPSIAATQEPKIRWDLSDEAAAQIGRVLPKAVRQDGEGLFVMATEAQMARIKALVKAKDGEEE